jgi:hypothetical protein
VSFSVARGELAGRSFSCPERAAIEPEWRQCSILQLAPHIRGGRRQIESTAHHAKIASSVYTVPAGEYG